MATRRTVPLQRALAALAVVWLAAVAAIELFGLGLSPSQLASSPDQVVAGHFWRLLTSSLLVADELPAGQLLLLVAVSAVVLVRHGAVVWWLAAVIGHVGSTLIAYGIIGVAIALGSGSAERVADDWDYGISCVTAALIGVVALGALRRLRDGAGGLGKAGREGCDGSGRGGGLGGDRRDRALDLALVAAAALSLLFYFVTLDWYGLEHLIAFALGAGVLAVREPRRPAQ